MKVISIDNNRHIGEVVYAGNKINVNISLISPKVGDFVLVHAGCAIEIVQKEAADEILEIFQSLEEIYNDGS